MKYIYVASLMLGLLFLGDTAMAQTTTPKIQRVKCENCAAKAKKVLNPTLSEAQIIQYKKQLDNSNLSIDERKQIESILWKKEDE